MRRKKINFLQQLVRPMMLGLLVLGLGLFNTGIIEAQNKPVKNLDLKANLKKTIVKDSVNSNENDKVFTEYETIPQFPGGETALLDFVYMNLKYPESAIKEKKEGKVFLRFVVTETGEIEKIQVVRSLQPDCDNEAIRVVKMLPKFIPGKYSGKPMSFWYTLPVTFKLPTIDNTDVILNQKFKPDHIFDVVEQMPQFPGGNDSLLSYVSKNLKWPNTDVDVFGRVICRFIVNRDGSVSNPEVIRSLDPACDKESIRVIKLLPKFIPGKQNGQVVNCWYTLPVTFKME